MSFPFLYYPPPPFVVFSFFPTLARRTRSLVRNFSPPPSINPQLRFLAPTDGLGPVAPPFFLHVGRSATGLVLTWSRPHSTPRTQVRMFLPLLLFHGLVNGFDPCPHQRPFDLKTVASPFFSKILVGRGSSPFPALGTITIEPVPCRFLRDPVFFPPEGAGFAFLRANPGASLFSGLWAGGCCFSSSV